MKEKMYVKIIKKNDDLAMEYKVGDILEVDTTWYGGVTVRTHIGMLVSLDKDEYEIVNADGSAGKTEEKANSDIVKSADKVQVPERFAVGDIVKHFKREWVAENRSEYLYKILAFASHTETGEQLVVYQGMYEPFKVCARPYEMFNSKVDKEKYPDITQEYRFEVVSKNGFAGEKE